MKIIHVNDIGGITYATVQRNIQVLIELLLQEVSVKSITITPIYHLIHLFMESLKVFVLFCSPNCMHVTCIYLQCCTHRQDYHHLLNKTVFIRVGTYVQVTTGLLLYTVCTFIDLPIHGEHFKLNPMLLTNANRSYDCEYKSACCLFLV